MRYQTVRGDGLFARSGPWVPGLSGCVQKSRTVSRTVSQEQTCAWPVGASHITRFAQQCPKHALKLEFMLCLEQGRQLKRLPYVSTGSLYTPCELAGQF